MNTKIEVKVPSLQKVYEDMFDIGAAVNLRTINTQKSLFTKHLL